MDQVRIANKLQISMLGCVKSPPQSLGQVYIVYIHFLLLGGPYSVFAGHDASRALAKFEVHLISEEYDDLSDLTQSELNEVKEWELQFSEKYTLVGKLLKPGEQPTSYSDDEGTDDEDAIAEENRKLKRLSSGKKIPMDGQEEITSDQ